MSFISELYTFINGQSWIPQIIQFDVNQLPDTTPYYNMVPLASEETSGVFCATQNGVDTIEFSGYGTDRKILFDTMDGLSKSIMSVRNNIPNYELWNLRVSRPIGYGTEDIRIYRYSFTLVTEWRVK